MHFICLLFSLVFAGLDEVAVSSDPGTKAEKILSTFCGCSLYAPPYASSQAKRHGPRDDIFLVYNPQFIWSILH